MTNPANSGAVSAVFPVTGATATGGGGGGGNDVNFSTGGCNTGFGAFGALVLLIGFIQRKRSE